MPGKRVITLKQLQILADIHDIPTHEGTRRLTKMQLALELFGPGGPLSTRHEE
jgi:hypothetical protein